MRVRVHVSLRVRVRAQARARGAPRCMQQVRTTRLDRHCSLRLLLLQSHEQNRIAVDVVVDFCWALTEGHRRFYAAFEAAAEQFGSGTVVAFHVT